MSKVSKLTIKAYPDNKFSSSIGEFVTSINPENLTIKSGISYDVAHGMASPNLLHYRHSPPRLLSFSLLFDNTGIIPGSNTIPVMEQVSRLQDIAYSVHKKKNAPNYIRVTWGQLDLKGRLAKLDIAYTMFQVDGTLVRAEAHMAILEEVATASLHGQTAAGTDRDRAKASGASVVSMPNKASQGMEDTFAATPNGVNGAYSGAPPGAYDGGPDDMYHGSPGAAQEGYSVGGTPGTGDGTVVGHAGITAPGAEEGGGMRSSSSGQGAGDGHGAALGVGGGQDGMDGSQGQHTRKGTLSTGKDKQDGMQNTQGKNKESKFNKPRIQGKDKESKLNKPSWVGKGGSKADSLRKLAGSAAAATGAASAAGLAAKIAINKVKEKFSLWQRLKMLAKKVVPKVYAKAKHVGGVIKDKGHGMATRVRNIRR